MHQEQEAIEFVGPLIDQSTKGTFREDKAKKEN